MKLKLNDRKWKEFYLSGDNGIFKNYHGKRLIKDRRIQGYTPLLTAGEQNQGVTDFISNHDMKKFKDFISIDMFGNAFYHEYICCGDDNIYFFVNDNISREAKLFITTSINNNKNKYSYGKQFRQRNADTIKVMLPVSNEDNTKPDWDFMKQYIEDEECLKKQEYICYIEKKIKSYSFKQIEELNAKKWGEFYIKDLFDEIQRGKRLIKSKQIPGQVPYVSSTADNNGVDNFISNDKNIRKFSNCLSLANSGSVGASFYEPFEFIASDHVTHLKNYKMNKFIYLFIATITGRLKDKYNFNREISDTRISKEKIILPIEKNGQPDYDYMEQYIKNIMISKYKEYMEYIKYNSIVAKDIIEKDTSKHIVVE